MAALETMLEDLITPDGEHPGVRWLKIGRL
jgi:hypothetical protein